MSIEAQSIPFWTMAVDDLTLRGAGSVVIVLFLQEPQDEGMICTMSACCAVFGVKLYDGKAVVFV
jgi:hypothetical protein